MAAPTLSLSEIEMLASGSPPPDDKDREELIVELAQRVLALQSWLAFGAGFVAGFAVRDRPLDAGDRERMSEWAEKAQRDALGLDSENL